MTTRRGFLSLLLAGAAAPAIVRASSLMPVYVPRQKLLTLWGDGIHDDTQALQAYIDGAPVMFGGEKYDATPYVLVPSGVYQISDTIKVAGSLHGGSIMLRSDKTDRPLIHFKQSARGFIRSLHLAHG